MSTELLRDAALRAAVWATISGRAKELGDEARAQLQGIEVGETVAAKWGGRILAKASMNRGKTKLVVTDSEKLLQWVTVNHPSEIISTVNPAYLKAVEARAKDLGIGAVIDSQGDVIPGVEIVAGEPTVSVRKEKDALEIVAELMAAGQLGFDGIKELEASNGDQVA